MLKSRLAAWLLISLTRGTSPGESSIGRVEQTAPPTVWFPTARDGKTAADVADRDLAFVRNLESLTTLIRARGATPVLVPFRIAPEYVDVVPETAQALRNERLLLDMAREHSIATAPFPADIIEPEDWLDDCHLNTRGNLAKAEHIARTLEPILASRGPEAPDAD